MEAVSAEAARKILHTALGIQASSLSIERTTEGGDHAAWYVGEDMVLRVRPIEQRDHADDATRLQKREVAVRRLLHDLFVSHEWQSMIPECLEYSPCAGYDGLLLVSCRFRVQRIQICSS